MNRQILSNFPIPEVHLVFLALGIALNKLFPKNIFQQGRKQKLPGWLLVLSGVFISGCAAKSAGEVNLESPQRITSTGVYAYSRNPMYTGWHLIFTGIILLLNNLWLLLLLPGLILFTHFFVILPEEGHLSQQLSEDYVKYKHRVSRYFRFSR